MNLTLRERRESCGLTLGDIARRLDVTKSAVCSWEAGRWGIQRKYKERLAKIYGCTVEELMEEVGE